MNDNDCIKFLQDYLPSMGYRWKGFRKVRKQVCKRIGKRIMELHLDDIGSYREHLEKQEDERKILDSLLDITISRFYRDRGVFDIIQNKILPSLAAQAVHHKQGFLRCWSAGSASGEEPYTLSIIWKLAILPELEKNIHFRIIAIDRNPYLIERAKNGIYPGGSMKELPGGWKEEAFEKKDDEFMLKEDFRSDVQFMEQDIRTDQPEGDFDLILCRNLVFTYFREDVQRDIFRKFLKKLNHGGYLIIGNHESIPEGEEGLVPVEKLIFRKKI